jgi:uncharacterized protein YidB (DUF937 family)
MGLLDDLLGGLAGQGMGNQSPQAPTRRPAGGTTNTSSVLLALLPVVLTMLSNRGSQRGMPGRMSSGGGLGDLLGQVLGGAAGGGGSAGGLGGILAQLQGAGFGEQADSWVGRGENKPIRPDAMSQIFGPDGLEQISRRAGLSREDTSRGLSELLPEASIG